MLARDRSRRRVSGSLALCALAATLSAEPDSGRLRVGSVRLANSGAPAAQADFAEGLAALHSFWYDAARDAFQRAQLKDPGFALAYWGEAMTHYHALWSGLNSSEGRRQMERLDKHGADRLDREGTAEERALVAAARKLYGAGGGDHGEEAFSNELRRAHRQYPESIEIAAFYALSLQGLAPGYRRRTAKDQERIRDSAAVLEELMRRAPDHPGVLHYLIHTYDDPEHAALGLAAAHRYSQVAPDAGHAQHMPAHIFLQLGDWESSAASNRRAWQASERWIEERGLPKTEKDFHSLAWLHYSLLQLGDFDGAARAIEMLRENGDRAWTVARYQARQLVETEDWRLEVAGSGDSSVFARGYAAAWRGELAEARRAIQELSATGGEEAAILGASLDGLVAHLEGDQRRALDLLSDAADREEATATPSGPPDLVKPALELLGEVLLRMGRCDQAVEALNRSLARMPGRRLSVRAARAAAACAGTP